MAGRRAGDDRAVAEDVDGSCERPTRARVGAAHVELAPTRRGADRRAVVAGHPAAARQSRCPLAAVGDELGAREQPHPADVVGVHVGHQDRLDRGGACGAQQPEQVSRAVLEQQAAHAAHRARGIGSGVGRVAGVDEHWSTVRMVQQEDRHGQHPGAGAAPHELAHGGARAGDLRVRREQGRRPDADLAGEDRGDAHPRSFSDALQDRPSRCTAIVSLIGGSLA